ncbi:hypothetical protein ONZ45_g11819 [Pleurotus djamor]|nr:hypothetical protein ONZ45_g11819 [Pleurotus djamor]
MLEPGATLQIVVEAHVRNGRISVYPALPPDLPPIIDFLGHEVTHMRDIAPRTFASCDYDPSTTLSSSYDNSFPTFQMKVSQWLNGLIRHPGSAQQLSTASDIPWDEDSAEGKKFWDQSWIRRWDLDDVKANRAFLLDPRPDRQKPEWWTGWTSQETL